MIAKYDPNLQEIPDEIRKAALTLHDYARRNNWGDDWQLMGLTPSTDRGKERDVEEFVKQLVTTSRGRRRAANLISDIARILCDADACEDLANASQAVQRKLVSAWEQRLAKVLG